MLAIILIAAILSGYLFLTTKRTYETQVRFITRQEPTPDNPNAPGVTGSGPDMIFTFNRYYNWFGSEFLVDDYTQITASDAFAQSVLATMKEPFFANKVMEDLNNQIKEASEANQQIPVLHGEPDVKQLETKISKLKVDDIKEGIESDRRHRELRLIVTATDPDLAKSIADASGTVLADASMKPIQGAMVDDKGVFTQIDRVGPANTTSNRGKEFLNAVVRVIMGLAAAIALVFLLEYLDNSVRDERDANRILDLPVLGSIPRS